MNRNESPSHASTGRPKAGPFVQENWRLARQGEPVSSTVEVPLYTDALITGVVKQLRTCPPQVQKKLRAWVAAVEQIGVDAVRKVPATTMSRSWARAPASGRFD